MNTCKLSSASSKSPTSKHGGGNCWAVGCGGCLGVLVLMLALGWAGWMYMKRSLSVDAFDPMKITEVEKEEARGKLEAVRLLDSEKGEGGADVAPIPEEGLVISERELNYWLSTQDPELAESVRLRLAPGALTAEVRAKMDGSDKRLGMRATVSVEQKGDVLDIRVRELKLGSFTLPKAVMRELAEENIGEEIFKDPEVRKAFNDTIERIEVREGEILLVPRRSE